ncbi:response regulator [Paenibacillus alkaliterrae]|uniref:response regulator n=1 Tax=Paenibacillus alkaliterrae TaxID=320909 RepID=UPI002E233832
MDDEPKHRRGLSRMLKELKPDYNIYSAMDGGDALQSMNAHSIDLIFTDIQMPIMDGLEFMEHVSRRGGDESVIIMSAYSHFEYVQRALRLGACDYLLKPVEEQKIIQLLEKAEQKVSAVRHASVESTLAELLEGSPANEDYDLLNKSFPAGVTGVALAAVFNTKHGTKDWKFLLNGLKAMMEPILEEFRFSFAFYMPDKTLVTMIMSPAHCPILTAGFEDRLHEVIRHFRVEYEAELTFGIGSPFTTWMDEARDSYEQANDALKTRFYKGGGTLLKAEKQQNSKNNLVLVKLYVSMLEQAVLSGDKPGIRSCVDSAINQVSKGYPQPEKLVYSIIAVLHHLTSCLMGKGLPPLHHAIYEEALMQCHTVEQLKKATHEWIFEITDCLENRKLNKNESIIESCKAYIENHYSEDLTLSTLAVKFHFNPSYFCNLFKNHTQTTVNQYITQTRMRVAEGLLLQTSQKVYQIAETVGYKDVKYFIRLFRKEFGTSPEEYRHLSAAH